MASCRYVTPELVREWSSTNSPTKSLEVPATRFIYELCWTLVRGELPVNKCRVALDAVNLLEPSFKDDTASTFADTIAHMGLELTVPGESRPRLVELAKWLVESNVVPIRFFQERCEAEFLWEADMIKIKAPDLKAKEVRVNTRLLYQQTKFNLLREESEGYAKLLTLLSQSGSDQSASQSLSAVVSSIKSLIGHFDLDPNRVFDIILEFFEMHPENDLFLGLIPLFPKSHLCHILGFKFQFYQRPEIEESVPAGLYRLAATLIKANFIDLDSLYVHLLPEDDEALEQYEEMHKTRMEEVNKIGKINLAATGKDLMEEEKNDVNIDLYAALDSELEATADRSMELVTNQKLGLLDGFLVVDDWQHANILLDRLGSLNPVAHERISNGILRAIENIIAPIYNRLRPVYLSKGEVLNRKAPVTDVNKELFQMLTCIGPYLYRDVLLLQKVCRVLKAYFTSAQSAVTATRSQDAEQHKEARLALTRARLRVEEALSCCLLPSLQLVPANPAVCLSIWDVLSAFPYEVRYKLYGEWEKDDEPLALLVAARQTAKLDTRRILKRLAKENLKQLGRMVAKIAHANPLTVLRTIVQQIEAYKDMITPVVDAFKYLTQFEYDVLEYVVLERLAQSGRDKLKEDGLNLSDWLQSLASFWGHLCKKYPSMELKGLFQYLVNQLKKGEGIELVILQELMQQMANIEYTENVTEDQLEAMSGGETLRYQATAYGKNNKAFLKSTNRLRDALLSKEEPKLALPLVLLIAQHRTNIINNADATYIKVVSEQYDRCHGALLQYVEFLSVAVSPLSAYAQLVPSLDELVHKYHIEPEVAFLIYRPVISLFKPVKNTGTENEHNTSQELILEMGNNRKTTTWSELIGIVHTMLPQKAWANLSPQLYLTFWGLSLNDLHVPRKRYEAEIAKQKAALKALEESTDNSYAAIAKRKKDKEKIQDILEKLSTELQKQETNVENIHTRLLREKDTWLTSSSCVDALKANMEFLQRCILPRCVFSMVDAVYCAKFVQTLHSLGTPLFNTVSHIDCLICKTLQPMISCCTEYEAGRLGKFLLETLKMAYHWKSDEAIYDRECANMPGFNVSFKDPNSPRITFSQFVRIHWKWSQRLTKVLVQCLESPEYMEIRNALTVLITISSVFPATKKAGINLERRVNKIKQEDREDLKVLAVRVSAALGNRKNAWMTDEEFTMGHFDHKPPVPQPKPTPEVSHKPDEVSRDASQQTRTEVPHKAKQPSQPKRRSNSSEPNGVETRTSPKDDDEARQPRKPTASSARSNKPETPREEVPNKVKAGAPTRVPLNSSRTPEVPKSRAEATTPKIEASHDVNHSSKSPSHREEHFNDKERQVKRAGSTDDDNRNAKRRKGEYSQKGESSHAEAGEIRTSERWLSSSERPRSAEHGSYEDRPIADKSRDRADHRDREEYISDKKARENRNSEWNHERSSRDKDERPRSIRHNEEQTVHHVEDRQERLPPPPPLSANVVPHAISSRREEEERRRMVQRVSPHRDEKRRTDDGMRRDVDERERKRDERELMSLKAEKERERERERLAKEDAESSGKRRKLKRDHLDPFLPPSAAQQQQYVERERKSVIPQPQPRNVYMEPMHPKDVPSKLTRREHDPMYEREWEDDKRRADLKRRHHRK